MTGINLRISNLSDHQIADINMLMSSGYFSTKSSMGRTALLLLVFVTKHMPKCLLFISKTKKWQM